MKTAKNRLAYWLSIGAIASAALLVFMASFGGEQGAVLTDTEHVGVSDEVDAPEEKPATEATRAVFTNAAFSSTASSDDPTRPSYGDMVRLPTGTFIMGLTDEDVYDREQAGRVVLAMPNYYIDRFEVTNREYLEFIQDQNDASLLPDVRAWGGDREAKRSYLAQPQFQDHPVLGVTWENAQRFCEWNGSRRLPTEAEWEYAARAGQIGAVYPWRGFRTTDGLGRYLANFSPEGNPAATGYSRTAPVGVFPPNRWGVHDMAGNAAEWVQDTYSPTYDHYQSGQSDPAPFVDETRDERVIRGGSWASNSFDIGVGVRNSQPQDRGSQEIGFRCAADLTQVEGTGDIPDLPGVQEPEPQEEPQVDPEFPEPDTEPEFPEPPSDV